jgi:BirA family biotin operon repressor/biotin-[acetyl-CoA-carboxylase] ligase
LLPATPLIILGEPLIELSSIDSTNIYAISQIMEDKALSGSCYRADFQTHGKGQQGKVWDSEKGENLLCSYVLSLSSLKKAKELAETGSLNAQFGLSLAVSLGVSDFFSAFAGEETKIKWPNDLYWRDRKAGGILIENKIRGSEWTWSIMGIGININQTQFNEGQGKPVSLKQITGKSFEINPLLHQLSTTLTSRVNEWLLGGFEKMLAEYNERLFMKGQEVKFKTNQVQFSAKVVGVNKEGKLIVNKGIEQSYNFGAITWEI